MKKIIMITLGGTISAKGEDRTDLKDYKSGYYTGEDFLTFIPELNDLAIITIKQMDNISSTAINSTHWISLRNKIDYYVNKKNYDGVVITHGTNTLEETAYFLHLTVPSNKPIVLTGAQRPFSAISTDAHLNLINAVRVAIDEQSMNKGVLVVLNNTIHSARDVTKSNAYKLEAFQAGQLGALGFIDPDETVNFYNIPAKKHTKQSIFSNLSLENMPKVEIIYSYAGATGKLINYISTSNEYKGIIMAGTGAGRFSPEEDAALHKARKHGISIVRSSRVESGRIVDIKHYNRLQAINSDNLTPQKARILLMLTLLTYSTSDDIQSIFDQY